MDHLSAVDERSRLTSSNQFELLVFRLGIPPGGDTAPNFGINVFKAREIMRMPSIIPIAAASKFVLGAADIRGEVIPVVDLPWAANRSRDAISF